MIIRNAHVSVRIYISICDCFSLSPALENAQIPDSASQFADAGQKWAPCVVVEHDLLCHDVNLLWFVSALPPNALAIAKRTEEGKFLYEYQPTDHLQAPVQLDVVCTSVAVAINSRPCVAIRVPIRKI